MKIIVVYFYNNFLNCDCYLSWFLRWLLGKLEVMFDGVVC